MPREGSAFVSITEAERASTAPAQAVERGTAAASTRRRWSYLPTNGYRLKRKLLGPPLQPRRSSTSAWGDRLPCVFASDNLSSSAYATEEILRVLVPAVGIAASRWWSPSPSRCWSCCVLDPLLSRDHQGLSDAGGAYGDARQLRPDARAGRGRRALDRLRPTVGLGCRRYRRPVSAFPELKPFTVVISVAFIILISYGNLRGVRESGRIFAVPTYFFVVNMVVLLGIGLTSMARGTLPMADTTQHGALGLGSAGNGLLMGATLYVVLHAFASGGAAVTGVEAISNGVPVLREPAWRNARSTLVVMGTLLGVMFLGLSVLAGHMHVVPFAEGTPTVISQIGDLVYGPSPLGRALRLKRDHAHPRPRGEHELRRLPRLASFHAGDNFMPRQLTSAPPSGVLERNLLPPRSIILVIVTGAKVDRLIPPTPSASSHRSPSRRPAWRSTTCEREPGWRRGLLVNGIGAFLSLVVDLIIAITKFTHGAWLVIVLVPIMVVASCASRSSTRPRRNN